MQSSMKDILGNAISYSSMAYEICIQLNYALPLLQLTREQAVEYLERIKTALEMMRTSEEHNGNALNEIRQPHVLYTYL